jgi:hypothetical protein
MSQPAVLDAAPPRHGVARPAVLFATVTVGLAVAAAVFAGWLPLQFSFVTVFLFAGPHNWLEFRYFLTRMPGRWGKLRGFFLFAFSGIFVLTALFIGLRWLAPLSLWSHVDYYTVLASWNTLLVVWVLALIHMRSRQNPRRDWFWTVPVGLVLIALNWLNPSVWGLGLVYCHPLMALWILDRELKRSRPEWRRAYHTCLLGLPLLLGVLWWRLAAAPPLPGEDVNPLTGMITPTDAITYHAGGSILPWVSNHLLVATHTFLEMLHYGVWLVAIPLVGIRTLPWRLESVPMAKRSVTWKRVFAILLVCGAAVTLILWGCFLADYLVTRDVYFTVALLHVLAEVPFLLRAL